MQDEALRVGIEGSLWVPRTPTKVKWAYVTDGLDGADGLVRITKSVVGEGFESVLIERATLEKDWRRVGFVAPPPKGVDEDVYFSDYADRARRRIELVETQPMKETAPDALRSVALHLVVGDPPPSPPAKPSILDTPPGARRIQLDVAPPFPTRRPSDPDRAAKVLAATEALYGVARARFPHLKFPHWHDLPEDVQGGLFDQIKHYDEQRQWEPFPRGDTAADPADQELLCNLANDLLGKAKGVPMGKTFVPRRGWASGASAQAQDPKDVDFWARMGYAALVVRRRETERERANFIRSTHSHGMGAVPRPVRAWDELHEDQKERWREKARAVAALASTAQIDAIRRALMEQRIDPAFAGPIVAVITFGGLAGENPELEPPA